ncbi:MAG: RHS repeat-associated core domain-containing protein [Microthrixaceae bacterium]
MGSPVLFSPPLAANASYDAYGAPAGTGSTISPTAFGYRAERTLNPGGDQPLIDLRNRTYDPALGIFLTPDPLDGVDGTTVLANPHHYTNNNPTNLTDPLGLSTDDSSFAPPSPPSAIPPGAKDPPDCLQFHPGAVEFFMRGNTPAPCGFQEYFRYKPARARVGSEIVAVNAGGDACSRPALIRGAITGSASLIGLNGALYVDKAISAFAVPCQSHDYGYDLLRFAKASHGPGDIVVGRVRADSVFNDLMRSVCQQTGHFGLFNQGTCTHSRVAINRGIVGWTYIEGDGLN